MMRAPWRPAPPRAALPPAGVLLASTGKPFTEAGIAAAARLAGELGPDAPRVRVITVARVHGSSFGLQHPGLMPNKQEKDAAQAIVTKAIKSLQRSGVKADGEIAITRSPARSFARSARAADVTHVVLDNPPGGYLARLDAWLAWKYLRFRLRDIPVATCVHGTACAQR
jgi:hypothetical protein